MLSASNDFVKFILKVAAAVGVFPNELFYISIKKKQTLFATWK